MTLKIRVSHGDTQATVAIGDCTGLDARDLRAATGLGLAQTFGMAAAGQVDLDVAATLLWLARRQSGERGLKWDVVAEKVTIDTPVRVEPVDADDEDVDPE